MPPARSFRLRLPCAVLRVSWLDGDGAEIEADAAPETTLDPPAGVFRTEATYAVLPWAGDPAVYDTATDWARQLDSEAHSGDSDAPNLRAFIYPGEVSTDGEEFALEEDDLGRELAANRPAFGPGVYLSSRSAKTLEYMPALESGFEFARPSGKRVPFYRFDRALYDRPHWRNPEVLGQTTQYTVRKSLRPAFAELRDQRILRISGPMGCGKTRLVWEELGLHGRLRLWLRARPPRVESPSLGEQVIRQVLIPSEVLQRDPLHPALESKLDRDQIRQALERRGGRRSATERQLLNERAEQVLRHLARGTRAPISVVIDDYQAIGPDDEALVRQLTASAADTFRFLFLQRSGRTWPAALEATPRIDIPYFDAAETQALWDVLTAGMGLPEVVRDRFLTAIAGSPFALEEGIFSLVHTKKLRSIYGSYFFGGDGTTEYEPSDRLIRHVEADVTRVGEALPIRLLALTDHPVPASELSSAASILGRETEPGWEGAFVEAGILESLDSSWGQAVSLASPYARDALSRSLSHEQADETRRTLGELLSLGGAGGESSWLAYQLLAGLPEAIEPLLAVFKSKFVEEIPPAELLEALRLELQLHRERGGGGDTELGLLWRLLPLARRMGVLHQQGADLARAVDLSRSDPKRLLGLAGMKAELEQEDGRFQDAENTLQRALTTARAEPAKRKALLLLQLGRLFVRQHRFDEAGRLFSSLIEPLEAAGASALSATCRFYLGNVALHQSDLDDAYAHHLAAYEQRKELKLMRAAGTSLSALGAVSTGLGKYPQALDYYRQARRILEEHGKRWDVSFSLLGLARAYGRIGDFTAATKPVRVALEIREGRDDTVGEAIARMAVAGNYLDLLQLDAALEEARKAHFQLTMSSAEEHLAACERLLGRIHLARRQSGESRRRLEEALKRFHSIDRPGDATFVLADLIEACIAEEDADGLRTFTADLKNLLTKKPPEDLGQILDLRIYCGLEWLAARGSKVGDPASYLSRAYRSLMHKAELLDHEQRQKFLFQIPANREIVDLATQKGLA